MNCALVHQVDEHPDSALEDTYSGLQSLLRIDTTAPIFCVFSPCFFFLKGGSILLYANSVINLLGLVIDLTQSSRGSSIALNCMHHKILSP